jgi:hypothetical protein
MVLAFDFDKEADKLFTSSVLESGFIIYDKKVVLTSNDVREVVSYMLENVKSPEFVGFVLRYKRRSNKWFVHFGFYEPKEAPVLDKTKFRIYDLQKRSHIWEEGAE